MLLLARIIELMWVRLIAITGIRLMIKWEGGDGMGMMRVVKERKKEE